MNRRAQIQKGFTIVELLIVIVVIAILAAVTIVAYGGIQSKAKENAAQSAASQVSKKIMAEAVLNADQYPASLATIGVQNSGDVTHQYTVNNSASPPYYCLTTTISGRSYKISSAALTPVAGGCPGHSANGVAAITNLAQDTRATAIAGTGVAGRTGWYGRWFGSGSTGTTTQITGAADGPAGTGITSYLRKQWNTVGTHTLDVGWGHTDNGILSYPTAPGKILTVSSYVRSSVAQGDGSQRRIWFHFYDAAGADVGSSGGVSVALPAGQWTRLVASVAAPANASFVHLRQDLYLQMTVGSTLDATGLMITEGSTPYLFADGASANWVWNGVPNSSTSTGLPL